MKAATLDRLYREHHEIVLARLRRRLHDGLEDQAGDALSEAWLILSRKPDTYLRADSAAAWLYVVALREAWHTLDPRRARDVDLESVELGGTDGDVLALVINRARVRELLDFITRDDVRAPRRRAVAARAVGIRYKELAEMTDTTYTNVNRHTAEGLREARELSAYAEL